MKAAHVLNVASQFGCCEHHSCTISRRVGRPSFVNLLYHKAAPRIELSSNSQARVKDEIFPEEVRMATPRKVENRRLRLPDLVHLVDRI